jgi:phosphoribosyl 1,2-cyclic phosphodiesterase
VHALLLGVRGSTPAPGADFVRYGGHTSCVAVVARGESRPRLVLDAGTGLRALTGVLGGAAFDGAILLSHLHWDHVQGLPFFAAGDRDDARVELHVPAQDGASARDLLARTLSPPSFPITPEGLRGRWTFRTVDEGRHEVLGFTVRAAAVTHKGGRTLGYRVEGPEGSLAYLPDHAPALGLPAAVRELVAGADVLLHDAQFLETERTVADAYGHATVDDAVALATSAGVGHLVLFHHSPGRRDDELDRLSDTVGRLRSGAATTVSVACEGARIDVGDATPGTRPTAPARG